MEDVCDVFELPYRIQPRRAMVLRTLRDSKENGHHTTSVWVICFLGDNHEKEDNKKEDKTRKGSGKMSWELR